MADETTPQPDAPANDGAVTSQETQRQPSALGKAVLAVGDWLDKPVKNKVEGYGYKNNAQMIQGRTNTAFNWALDSVEKPFTAAMDAFGSGKIEDLYINVPLAMAEQLLKILDGLNNWIRNIERHPMLGEIKDMGDETRNLSRSGEDSPTQNLSRPENAGNQTQNIPPPQGRTDDTPTTNLPPAQTNTGRSGEEQTANLPPAQNQNGGKQTSNTPPAQTNAGRSDDKQTTTLPPAQGRTAEKQLPNTPPGQQQSNTPVSVPRQSQPLSKSVSEQQQPGKTTPKSGISVAGLKLNETASMFSQKTISVKDNALAGLNQSRTARENASQFSKVGKMLANMLGKNKPRIQQPQSRGLSLGNRGMAMA